MEKDFSVDHPFYHPLNNIAEDIGISWDDSYAITKAFNDFTEQHPGIIGKNVKEVVMQFVGRAFFFESNPLGITEEQTKKITFITVMVAIAIASVESDPKKAFKSMLKSIEGSLEEEV